MSIPILVQEFHVCGHDQPLSRRRTQYMQDTAGMHGKPYIYRYFLCPMSEPSQRQQHSPVQCHVLQTGPAVHGTP